MEIYFWSEVMKNIQVDDTMFNIIKDLSKKHGIKTMELFEKVFYPLHSQMKKTGRKVL